MVLVINALHYKCITYFWIYWVSTSFRRCFEL